MAGAKPRPPVKRTRPRLRPGEKRDRTPTERAHPNTKEPLWVPLYLDHLAKYGLPGLAAKHANIHLSTVYEYRKVHASFELRWNAALEDACDVMEQEAIKRAVHGTVEDVYGCLGRDEGNATGVVGQRVRKSDRLLMFLLRHNRPEKYGETPEPPNTGPTKGYVNISPDDWDAEQTKVKEPTDE